MDAADCPFESHKEYFDGQYVVEGEGMFRLRTDNLIPSVEYDAEKDLIFLSGTCGFRKCHLKSRGFYSCRKTDMLQTNDSKWFLSRKRKLW